MNNDTIANVTEPQLSSEEMSALFAQLRPEDIEQFYQTFQRWTLQRQVETLQAEIAVIQDAIAENAIFLEEARPSAIAQATLAQLQARGVNDLDLLDKMLERGESWLDHTMQLLIYCERFGVMRGSYTEWCEHALEGAYEWIRSMKEAGATSMPPRTLADHDQRFDPATEALLLQKLMSEGEETIKLPVVGRTRAKITQPLADRKITQPLAQRKITQPLAESELMPEASSAPAEAAGAIEVSPFSAGVTETGLESAAPTDEAEAPTAAIVTTLEEIESTGERTEQAAEGAVTTVAEAEAPAAIVVKPGDSVAEPESTGIARQPKPADEIAGAETVDAAGEAGPADVATGLEVIEASDAQEARAEASESGEQPGQEAETSSVALQEVEQEVSIVAGPQAGDVQTPPEAEDGAEDIAEDSGGAPQAAAAEHVASEEPAEMIEEPAAELVIINTAFSELEDTQPLQVVVPPLSENAGRVEAIPSQMESAGPQVQYHAPPGQRPRKRRRFFLWRWLASIFRRL